MIGQSICSSRSWEALAALTAGGQTELAGRGASSCEVASDNQLQAAATGWLSLDPYIAVETSGWWFWQVFPLILPLIRSKIPVAMKKTRSPRKA